jgi:hypothetical protein
LPIVIFGEESPAAQAFTLAHELSHIVLKESGIIGPVRKNSSETEKWCDQFSASFLMPRHEVKRIVGPVPKVPANEIGDTDLARYASFFRVRPNSIMKRPDTRDLDDQNITEHVTRMFSESSIPDLFCKHGHRDELPITMRRSLWELKTLPTLMRSESTSGKYEKIRLRHLRDF